MPSSTRAHPPRQIRGLTPTLVVPAELAARMLSEAIVEDPAGWKRAVRSKQFTERLTLTGESLARPPRDFPADHPLVEDLKREDFIADRRLKQGDLTGAGFEEQFLQLFEDGAPLMCFICGALELPFWTALRGWSRWT